MAEFKSPFDDLGRNHPAKVTGQMECFTCYEIVAEGTLDDQSTLVFTCSNGHENVLKDYRT